MLREDEGLRFRFRKIESLLGKYQELERQSVYFASSQQQNDPMEGMIDLRWQGDATLWKNFFLHYFRCLFLAYTQLLIAGPEAPLEAPVFASSQSFPEMEKSFDFRLAKAKFLGNCDLRRSARLLGRRKRDMGQNEVEWLLRRVHVVALNAISTALIGHGADQIICSNSAISLAQQISATDAFEDQKKNFDQLESLHRGLNSTAYELMFIAAYNQSMSGKINNGAIILSGGFPDLYIRRLRSIVHSECYAACFVKNYDNSSMWSHYAGGHTGACLIYTTDVSQDGLRCINLNGVSGHSYRREGSRAIWGNQNFTFHDVDYVQGHQPVDFFSSLGCLPLGVIQKDWYTHGKFQTSKLGLADDTDEWRKIYWQDLERNALSKTRDWSYENESRLLLHGMLGEKPSEERLFSYDFKSLKGLIFGINMSEDDKLRICKVIENKCKREQRTDFEFYQAYFETASKAVKVRRLTFLKFRNNISDAHEAPYQGNMT